MSKNTLNEILLVTPEKFNIMAKNMPDSEKPEVLLFLQKRYDLLENIY